MCQQQYLWVFSSLLFKSLLISSESVFWIIKVFRYLLRRKISIMQFHLFDTNKLVTNVNVNKTFLFCFKNLRAFLFSCEIFETLFPCLSLVRNLSKAFGTIHLQESFLKCLSFTQGPLKFIIPEIKNYSLWPCLFIALDCIV